MSGADAFTWPCLPDGPGDTANRRRGGNLAEAVRSTPSADSFPRRWSDYNSEVQLFFQRVFDAIANGAIYSALAVALSLGYRSSGHLNFALGEGSMVSTYAALILATKASPRLKFSQWAGDHLGTPWPVVPAFLAAMLVGFLISVAIYAGFMGRGRPRSVAAVV